MSFGGETFQKSPIWGIGNRVRVHDRTQFFNGKLATIVAKDGMGSYTLKFDDPDLNEVYLESRTYWELELLPTDPVPAGDI